MRSIHDPNHVHNFPHRGAAVPVNSSMSVHEQLDVAGLNWLVDLREARYTDQYGQDKVSPFKIAVRSSDDAPIDVYKTRKPWQNYQIVENFNEFCIKNNLEITHLGFLPNTWTLFAVAPLPELLAPPQEVNDLTEGYLFLTDSHMHGTGIHADVFASRLVCTNGMLVDYHRTRKMAHLGEFNSESVTTLLENTRENYLNRMEKQYQLADIPLTYEEALAFLIKTYGRPGELLDDQPKVVQTCIRLFDQDAKGGHFLSAYKTALGLLESVKEFYNHMGNNRGGSVGRFTSLLNNNQGRGAQIQKIERQLVSVYVG
jgi:hypothetical protein